MPPPIQLTTSVSHNGRPGSHNPDSGVALRTPGDHPPIASLYIHTPFCVHKCHYCDFYSFVDTRDQQGAFIDRLIDELRALAPHAARPLRTVFVGGGTPSLLAIDQWDRLLKALGESFDLSAMHSGTGEFTVECNPESTTPELLARLRGAGVNRVSVGAQSFEPRFLKTLERWHDPDNVARAVELARGAGIPRQSIDLIYAIPGQTLSDWQRDLARGLALGTSHISCYNLTYEPNTAMTKRLAQGEFTRVSDELEAEMFQHTVEACRDAGLDRYEVSNFARPGHESVHNLAYWEQDQWLAAGPSASGHVFADARSWHSGSWRFKNVPRLGDYLASAGHSPVVDLESPDPLRLLRERVMMGLRLSRGIDARSFLQDAERLDLRLPERVIATIQRLRDEGLLTITPDRWVLSDAGFLVGDSVAAELMNALRSKLA